MPPLTHLPSSSPSPSQMFPSQPFYFPLSTTNISLSPRFFCLCLLDPDSKQALLVFLPPHPHPIPFPSSSLTHTLPAFLPLSPDTPPAPSYSPSKNNHGPPSLHHLATTPPMASHPELSASACWTSMPVPKATQIYTHLPSSYLLKLFSFSVTIQTLFILLSLV